MSKAGKSPSSLNTLKKKQQKKLPGKEAITKNRLHNLKDKKGVAVRSFSYLGHMSIASQWLRYSRELFSSIIKDWEASHIKESEEKKKEKEDAISSSGSNDDYDAIDNWITTDEVIQELTANPCDISIRNWAGNDDIRPPKMAKNAYEFMIDNLSMVGQQSLLGYNNYCRKSKRATINSVDCASQILSVHGMKDGTKLLREMIDVKPLFYDHVNNNNE